MTEWDNFEDHLRASLRRVEAPAGLQERILHAARLRRLRRQLWLRAAAVLLLVISAAAYGVFWRLQVRARQAEQARRQLELAIQITNRRLSQVEQQLSSIGVKTIRFEEVSQ